jgi:outer membrane protein assembly factor BamB
MHDRVSLLRFYMPFMPKVQVSTAQAAIISIAFAVLLAACSGNSKRPQPADLGTNTALLGVRQAWVARSGQVPSGALPAVVGTAVVFTSSDGSVTALDAANGRDLWRSNAGDAISTGAGFDGKLAAVVTRSNELVALNAEAGGKELWRMRLGAQVYTAPLVAGGRVFVVAADRSVSSFDGATGRKLWTQARTGEPLVLQQAGSLQAVGDTLVVGLSGRLVGLNPGNGTVRWEVPLASPRGTNEIERLVDIVGRSSREGNTVCARAFQANVGCIDAVRGTLQWIKPANAAEGVHGDEGIVVGTELDGKVIAWKRADGERAWVTERLLNRSLTAPLVVGRTVVLGDNAGNVHLLSREDGSPLNRLATDTSGIAAAPVLAGGRLIVVTRNGGVYGFAPE